MQGEIGGGVHRLLAGSGFHCTAYNVGIIYTFLCLAVMNYGTTADPLYSSLSTAVYTNMLHFFRIKNVKIVKWFNENASTSGKFRPPDSLQG